jgi:glycine dehydrogenase subunit 1
VVYPYIPNSVPKIKAEMMKEVDAKTDDEIFSMIPDDLKLKRKLDMPEPLLDEYSIKRHTTELLNKNANASSSLCFLGSGCAYHFIPALCDEVAARGELLTSYAGSGTMDVAKGQLVFEYCSLMAELLDMDCLSVAQVCPVDSSAHAFRMASRIRKRKTILVPETVGRDFLLQVKNYDGGLKATGGGLDIVQVKCDWKTGMLDLKDLKKKLTNKVAGVFIQNPTYLGTIEMQAGEIGNLARKNGSDFIVWTDPISLGVMEAPGAYGATIVVGNLQSLGIHMNAGGGVGGFIAVKDKIEYINSFKDMLFGYTPTSEPGEFSVSYYTSWDRTMYGRREQGVEFTGTNAALYAILAGVYIASLGPQGMAEVGRTILQRSQYAQKKIAAIPGVKIAMKGASFKEFVVNFDATGKTVRDINAGLLKSNIFGGKDISDEFPALGRSAVFCVTEAHTKGDIDRLADMLEAIVLQ